MAAPATPEPATLAVFGLMAAGAGTRRLPDVSPPVGSAPPERRGASEPRRAGANLYSPARQPRSDAYFTMSTRDFAPSFSIARALYVSTVFTLMLSRAAICLFE